MKDKQGTKINAGDVLSLALSNGETIEIDIVEWQGVLGWDAPIVNEMYLLKDLDTYNPDTGIISNAIVITKPFKMTLECTKYYKSTTHPDLHVRAVGEYDTISVMITMNGRHCSFVTRPNRTASLSATNWEECDKEHFEKLYNKALKSIQDERNEQLKYHQIIK